MYLLELDKYFLIIAFIEIKSFFFSVYNDNSFILSN